MKTHYTAKELAGLPGLPRTERGVQNMAGREVWPHQKRSGKGGGREYAVAGMPALTREWLVRAMLSVEIPPNLPLVGTRHALALPVVADSIQPAATTAQLKQWQRDIMEARVGIMRLIERAAPVIGVDKAIKTIVEDSINTDLAIYRNANARKGENRHLSYGGVIKWWMTWKKSGGNHTGQPNPQALAPKDTENYLEPVWATTFMTFWSKGQNPCLTDVLEQYYRVTGCKEPSYAQARHYLEKIGKVQSAKGRVTGKDLRALKPFRRRDTSEMYPGGAYTADGHCFDAEVYHPYTGKAFRPEVTTVIDVFSRKCVGWSVDLAESGLAVLDALRMACETHGIPAIFYTDNGSGFKNQMMTAPGTGILNRLGISPEYSRPRNPQAHGLSERGHQTILIKMAQQMCTYIGDKMDGDTKQLVFKKTRKAMAEGVKSDLMFEFEEFVNGVNYAAEHYNDKPHKGLPALRDPISKKLVHQSPNQAWQLGLERMKRELPQDEWLEVSAAQPDLYHPALERVCTRGEVTLGKLKYFSKELEHWTQQRVQVAYSPSDPSKVWVRDLEHQRLLAVAVLAGNSSAYFAESVEETARKKRGATRLKRLENHAEEVKLEMYGPQPVAVENPARAKLQIVKKQMEDAEIAQASVFELPKGERERQYLWQEIDKQLLAGAKLSLDTANFHRGWQNSDYFKIWNELNNKDQELATPDL